MSQERSAEFWRGRIAGLQDISSYVRPSQHNTIAPLAAMLQIATENLAEAEAREAGVPEECTCANCMPSNWPDTNGWRCKRSRVASVPTAAECELGDYYLDQGSSVPPAIPRGKPNPCTCLVPDPCTCHGPSAADLAVADELDMLAAHIQQYVGPDDCRDDIRRICRNRAEDLRRGVKRVPTAAEVKAQIIADYIDGNGMKCDCCQHVMIDVTASKAGGKQHCIAGDPEGEGSGCAWGVE